MNQCLACRQGTIVLTAIERWMRKDGRWVLVKHVPALQCDVCGETSFSQDVAERLVQMLAKGSTVSPAGYGSFPEYDYAERERPPAPAASTGERKTQVMVGSTGNVAAQGSQESVGPLVGKSGTARVA